MIKPLPFKREAERFEVEDLWQGCDPDSPEINSDLPLELHCQARYDESVRRFGRPELARGVAYKSGGAYLSCWMRVSPLTGKLQHRHRLFADPHDTFPWTDPFTNETYDMVKREADHSK